MIWVNADFFEVSFIRLDKSLRIWIVDLVVISHMRADVTMLDGPQTNEGGQTEGLTYVYCRVEWGLYLDLLEALEKMPYADVTDERLYGPAPSWTYRPDHSD
ncbi:hypothetical protein [Haladaptatus halobius]|uniref:hypothetical protein n=1 Tax=Haladaptatus halobius TaxID=2884875 RepID=UPI001D0AD689|nr:hypothetical protein [Haladaptatus halobius]